MKLKYLKLLIFPFVLTFVYFFLFSLPYFFSKINYYDFLGPLSVIEESPLHVEKTPGSLEDTDRLDRHLLQGDTISINLKASENNFGIILFRFAKLSGKVTDSVTFSIKQKGATQWYYTHAYKANQFQPDQYFTFGFPPFIDSKNHFYTVAITSLYGTYTNGIGVSKKTPDVALVYKYSRSDLKHLPTLFSFVTKKFLYIIHNINFFQDWEIIGIFIVSFVIVMYMKDKDITMLQVMKFSKENLIKKKTYITFFQKTGKYCVLLWRNTLHWLKKTPFYARFLNTRLKKRLILTALLFLFALIYRYTASLVNTSQIFYASLGGGGDYDQFIRAATCALKFCPAILGQNFLFESSLLGVFYSIFGFVGGLQVYLYLMILLSSIVATLPYIILSRKNWITIGGIIGSLFLATSDYFINMALGLPPDNGSIFLFSMFFIVYLFTIHFGTVR